jgi:hypothetical protein
LTADCSEQVIIDQTGTQRFATCGLHFHSGPTIPQIADAAIIAGTANLVEQAICLANT